MSSLSYENTVIKGRAFTFFFFFCFPISYDSIEEMVHNMSALYLPSYATFKILLLYTKGLNH